MSRLDGDSGYGWQISTFFSLCLDVLAQISQGHPIDSREVGDVITLYNALMIKAEELNIKQLITQKPLVNVGGLAVINLLLIDTTWRFIGQGYFAFTPRKWVQSWSDYWSSPTRMSCLAT